MGINSAERLKEVFRYFQAASHAFGLEENDIDDPESYNPALSRVSLDPVLNALCKLGVHELKADRAFISLIDHESQYIISEMTKSVSLYDTDQHDEGDGICLGARPLDLFAGVCAGTLPAFTDGSSFNSHHINTANIFADETRYIINDFTLEPKYQDRPYVKGFPHMRGYCEVPIKTSKGYVIGTYAVVDNKPRKGLSEKEFIILTEIAASIMRHIDAIKIQEEYARSSRLLQGLNTLVQDVSDKAYAPSLERPLKSAPGIRDGSHSTYSQSRPVSRAGAQDHASHLEPASRSRQPATGAQREGTGQPDQPEIPPGHVPSGPATSGHQPAVMEETRTYFTENDNGTPGISDSLSPTTASNAFADSPNDLIAAAEVLRRAMGLAGVQFMDVSLKSMAEHATASKELSERSPGIVSIKVGEQVAGGLQGPSRVLGVSNRSSRSSLNSAPSQSSGETSQALLQALLMQYPDGGVFNFELIQPLNESRTRCDIESARRLEATNLSYEEILEQLRHTFPRAKSVVFLPLWNVSKHDWYACCLGWSGNRRRVFEREDLAYMSVFGNSLVARATRLDLIATDQAKSDFISNVSHELRSPLHGILGSTELLQELVHDSEQQQLIALVQQCGRTLLDTMNQVLDYSKIDNAAKRIDSRRMTDPSATDDASSAITGGFTTFDLSALVEEVVESMVAGHQHSQKALTHAHSLRNDSQVADSTPSQVSEHVNQLPIVILHIQKRDSWRVRSATASWRRCILNLLGNALKYTDQGHIELFMRCTRTASDAAENVTVVLRDTGRGIGRAYLENDLFRPFVQEDPLSSGTGLGLSIAKSLVEAMGGRLGIQSEVNIGTKVEFTIPVEFEPFSSVQNDDPLILASPLLASFNSSGARKLNSDVVGQPPYDHTESVDALRDAVGTHLRDWCGVTFENDMSGESSTADVVIVEESNIFGAGSSAQPVAQSSRDGLNPMKLVLCDQHNMHHHSAKSAANRDDAYYLSQPFGPRKVALLVAEMGRALKARAFDANRTTAHLDPKTTATTLSLPTRPVTGRHTYSAPPTSKAESQEWEPRTPRVLLVDDNDVNLALLVQCIRKQKLTYATASNGLQAVEAYQAAEYDFVIMDISMPVMDGFAATRAIREYERSTGRSPAKIVALTGLGNADSRAEGFQCGMDEYLTKPVKLATVKQVIWDNYEAQAV